MSKCTECNEYDKEKFYCTKWCKVIKGTIEDARADERERTIDKVNNLIKTRLINNLNLENATKYGNKNAKEQANSYATVMKYEIADCVEDLIDDLEQLKEQKNE